MAVITDQQGKKYFRLTSHYIASDDLSNVLTCRFLILFDHCNFYSKFTVSVVEM